MFYVLRKYMWHRVGGFLFFIIPLVKQFSFHVEMELHLDFKLL